MSIKSDEFSITYNKETLYVITLDYNNTLYLPMSAKTTDVIKTLVEAHHFNRQYVGEIVDKSHIGYLNITAGKKAAPITVEVAPPGTIPFRSEMLTEEQLKLIRDRGAERRHLEEKESELRQATWKAKQSNAA